MNMVPAWNTAANNAKMNHRPYGMLITTTPGMMATEEGEYCFRSMQNATKFDENWYNLTYNDIMNIIGTNERSTFVYIEYTYQQLGYSEEWFRDLCKNMELNWDDIRREVLLEWSPTVENSPFRKEDLDIIRGLLRAPIGSFMLFNKYTILVYERMDMRHIPLVGVDVSGGYQHDSSAITVVDSWTTKVTAEFNCNWIPTLDLAAVLVEMVGKYMPNAVVNIERNGGYGATVIAKLLQTPIKRNLFFTIKDRVVEERYGGGREVFKRKQKTKVFGSDSTHEEREKLMEILRNRVDYHKDKIISKTIYDELCSMEVKKNGRIEHSSSTHDDQVFSWLWALYILYEGGDLMRQWGIERHEIKTDADLEEAVFDFEQDKQGVDVDFGVSVDAQEIVDQQMNQLNNAPGKVMYADWVKSEIQKDKAALENVLRNKKAREAYARDMHLHLDEVGDKSTIVELPMDVYLNGDVYGEQQVDQGNLGGNLLNRLNRVFGSR